MTIPVQSFRKLLADFPCITPSDSTFHHFYGFIKVADTQFRVSVSSDCTSFSADAALKSLLAPSIHSVRDRLNSASDVHEFLVDLRDIAERRIAAETVVNTTSRQAALPDAHFYQRLLTDISRIGWSNVAAMTENMRSIDLIATDTASRTHIVNVTFPTHYPIHPPSCLTTLPIQFDLQWHRDSTLSSLLRQFQKAVAHCHDFFRVMEDLDNNSWVLEPEHPTTRDTYRRLALGKTCSIRVEIDPRVPLKGFPEIRFLGSEAAVEPFKERLNQNIQKWDMSGKSLPRENLERVLDVRFPQRADEESGEGNLLECGICYAYRLDEAVPDVVCDLKECSKPYHRTCLVEWLRSLPDTRESFGTISGSCVYCEQNISLAVAAD